MLGWVWFHKVTEAWIFGTHDQNVRFTTEAELAGGEVAPALPVVLGAADVVEPEPQAATMSDAAAATPAIVRRGRVCKTRDIELFLPVR